MTARASRTKDKKKDGDRDTERKGMPVTGQIGVPEVSKSEDEALEFLGFIGIQARSKENSFLSME